MPKITPYFLRNLFGDALKGLWFPAVQDDAGNVLDLSGNGADGQEFNGSIVERRQLAPGVPGKSGYMNPDDVSIIVSGAECSGDMTVMALAAKDTPESNSNTYLFDWNVSGVRAALIVNDGSAQVVVPDGAGGSNVTASPLVADDIIAAGQSELIRFDMRKEGTVGVQTSANSGSKSISTFTDDFSGGTFRIADANGGGRDFGWTGPIQFFALIDADMISDERLELAWETVRDLSGVANRLTPYQTSDASRYVTGRPYNWLTTYSPKVLLEHEETRGTIAADWSGDENDGLYVGDFTLNVGGPFGGKAVDFPGSGSHGRVSFSDLPSMGPDFSLVVAANIDSVPDTNGYLFDCATNRFVLAYKGNVADSYGFYDGTWKESGYKPGLGWPILAGVSLDSGASEGILYLNGLPLSKEFYSALSISGDASIGSFNADEASSPAHGQYSSVMACDATLTPDDFHQQAVDIGAAPPEGHWYKTKIVDELGLATLGVQGDVLAHAPLDETAGTQARDVSMYENHFDFVGGPTLGQSPLSPGFSYCIETDTGSYVEVDTGEDFSSGEYTFLVEFEVTVGVGGVRNICGVTDGSQNGIYALTKDNKIQVRFDDGSNPIEIVYLSSPLENGDACRFAVRFDWSTGSAYGKSIMLSGPNTGLAHEFTQDISSVTSMAPLTNPFRFGASPGGGFNNVDAKIGAPTIFGRALTDNEIDGLLGV